VKEKVHKGALDAFQLWLKSEYGEKIEMEPLDSKGIEKMMKDVWDSHYSSTDLPDNFWKEKYKEVLDTLNQH